ncbi:MAG: chorismate-binding protein [Gammaproteobacteria bacterium]|nr:chorismate-binding protein [Gammaproteobacteria bacterium]MBU0848843.1 chorismate-binding protein [Gammaproteobacteria bacterium]MBU1266838.1 chorismate-binding protein [Gammaproteobacteria bacterium]MBU1529444.1 chorismate-binding protein [Gammaproteobacteria bacterium]MBU1778944.1 chorismate-binding protein [Gammaproteobacteria bacterium]
MTSPIVSAAWHAKMTRADVSEGLCVASGSPVEVLRTCSLDAINPMIDKAHALARQGMYVVGGLSYEAAPAFDPSLQVCETGDFPLLEFHAFEPGQISVWSMNQIKAMAPGALFHPWQDGQTSAAYGENFARVRRAIEAGEFYQINLTTRLKARCEQRDSWALFQHLYLTQTAPQSLFLRGTALDVLSLSPELFFQWDGVELQTAPMKGTRRPQVGGFDVLSDSEKDRAENVMIVDLLRNDMAKVCMPRSVQVRSLFDVMHLPTVDQMTSSISGTTASGTTLRDIFAALFPCGSVTGAPKAQAMLRIAQWEKMPRKFYCGALGVLSPGGTAHFNVPIRTVIASRHELEYGVGSGITWYSTQVDEKKEWWQKTTFLRQATRDFQLLETLRLEHGQWLNLDGHIARMAQAADYFSYVFDQACALGVLDKLACQHAQGIFRARCLLNADGEFNVELHPFESSDAPVQLRLANIPMNAHPEFILHKTTHRPEYDRFLDQAQGAFDVLLFNEAGDITETCRCNLIVKIQGELLTPQICSSTSTYLLPGVLRARLLRENTIRQARLNVQDLQRAEQVWVINSLRGWVPVSKVLGTEDEVLFSNN